MAVATVILRSSLLFACVALPVEGMGRTPGEVRLYEENDFFNPFEDGSDRFYTQGLRVEWLESSEKSGTHFLPGVSHENWCRFLCGRNFDPVDVNTGYSLGQNIYTPQNIAISRPQPYDRPWAGMLYLSRIARANFDQPELNARRRDQIELTLGIVGPASLAKQAQTEWHKFIGVGLPQGWKNQLRNEPIVQLRYETALRWPKESGGHADIIPRVRANVGNALTSLEADVTIRIGSNLSGFGASVIPAPPPSLAFAARQPAVEITKTAWRPSANLFVRAGAKAVAHNIFLDGNTFARNDIRINRTPFVPEAAAGLELLAGKVFVTLQFVHRGSEFESWRGRRAPAQEFGAISAGVVLGK